MADDDVRWITIKVPVTLPDPRDEELRERAVAEAHAQVVQTLTERGRTLAGDYEIQIRGGDNLAPDQVMMVAKVRHLPAADDVEVVEVPAGGQRHG